MAALIRGIPSAMRRSKFAYDVCDNLVALGRAEALAELRAGAEPVYQVWGVLGGIAFWREVEKAEYDDYAELSASRRVVYTHPPVPREAELAAENEQLAKERKLAISLLKSRIGSLRSAQYSRAARAVARTLKAAYGVGYGTEEWRNDSFAAAPETRG